MKRSALTYVIIHARVMATTMAVAATLLLSGTSMAWDATAHRISAYLAWDRLSGPTQQTLSRVLSAHPRFESDFMETMPASVQRRSGSGQQQWLFGQAAIWPDVARGLPDNIRDEFNRPGWHWIDGAIVRDHATGQGNIYLEVPGQSNIDGHRRQDDNVLTALERSRRQLLAPDTGAADRALALSWFLHLAGDLHQPLHTGALFAPGPLENGDRGGNLIRVSPGHEGSNLHALWDRALRSMESEDRLQDLRQQRTVMQPIPDTGWAPTRWLAESRGLLHSRVYPPVLRTSIRQGIERHGQIPAFDPGTAYKTTMLRIARQQLIRSAERMAATLTDMDLTQ